MQVLNDTLDEMDLIDIFRTFYPNAEEYTSSQMHMEHSPGQNTSWVTSQTSVNLRKLKSYQASFLTTTLLDQILTTRKKTVRNTDTCTLNKTFLNNLQVTGEIKREIKKFLETNNNENMTTQNLWDPAKAVLRGNFIAIQSYLKKQEKHRIDNLTLDLKQLEKEQRNSKISRRK